MVLMMAGPENRRTPRTLLTALPYVIVEPDNGAMVPNASEAGLCLQSVAPLEADGDGTIRFWFTDSDRRIQAQGKLIWTDKARTAGGLAFTSALPADAREQVQRWIREASRPVPAEEQNTSPVPPSQQRLVEAPNPPASTAPVAEPSVPPVAASAASTAPPGTSAEGGGSPAEPIPVEEPATREPRHWTGFSRGFAAGFLIAALVAAIFSFHTYRRQLGESIIRFGEQLAAHAQRQPQTAESMPQEVSVAPVVQPAPPASPSTPPASEQAITKAENDDSQQVIVVMSRPAATLKSEPRPINQTPVANVRATAAPPAAFLASPPAARDSELILPKTEVIPKLASDSEDLQSPLEMYLEVAKFKEELQAHSATDSLGQMGFHAMVIQKGHLWMDSYHVLVGPFGSERDAKAARKKLTSEGYQPKSFERGSRYFRLPTELQLTGTPLPVGRFVITWESYVTAASVTLVQDREILTTADARWMKHECAQDHDAVVYRQSRSGAPTLLEFHFRGMGKVLAFERSAVNAGKPPAMPIPEGFQAGLQAAAQRESRDGKQGKTVPNQAPIHFRR